jgi:aminopeptidase N
VLCDAVKRRVAALRTGAVALIVAVALAASPTSAQGTRLTSRSSPFRVTHYDLALDLPESGTTIRGDATLRLERTAAGDTLVLDLLDMDVSRVQVNGQNARFVRDSSTLRLSIGAGARFDVRVTYAGAPRDGLIIGTDSAGRWMAFGDNWPNRARHWIPSIDHPSAKATVTWTVRAPSDRRVVANGALVEETPLPIPRDPDGSAGRPIAWTVTKWSESRPIPAYLMVIAAAPLARYELGVTACAVAEHPGCVPQQLYVAPEQRAAAPGNFAQAGAIVEYFGRLVGPFPYEKLAHLQSSTRFGGMENASAIFYADGLFRKNGASAGLIAHETAHQWFGDAVTEREWSHLWLSEGFATYFAALYLGHAHGDSALVGALRRDREGLVKSANVAARPVIDTAQTVLMALLNDNSYQKGGWVLHMLRLEVGDSAFFGGIRDYYAAHRHQTALTDDLRLAVEKRHGKPLGWFFDQWLRRPGVAELTTSWTWDAKAGAVSLVVEQGTRFAPYQLTLPLEITERDGTKRMMSVRVPAERRAALTIKMPRQPSAIVADPGVGVLGTVTAR